jgi:hypothetical protein
MSRIVSRLLEEKFAFRRTSNGPQRVRAFNVNQVPSGAPSLLVPGGAELALASVFACRELVLTGDKPTINTEAL